MWTIYLHRNIVNDKCYVGQTKQQNIESRFGSDGRRYLRKTKLGRYNQPLFASAIIKYGWNSFEHKILETNIMTQEEANEKERYYISKYNCLTNGYNTAKGGVDSTFCLGKKIYEIDKNKNIIKEFDNATSAARFYNFKERSRDGIIRVCTGLTSSYKGKYFCYADDYDNYNITQSRKRNVVLQFDENGELINRFSSLTEASKFTSVRLSHISGCCHNRRKTAGGYYWCYELSAPKSVSKSRGLYKAKRIGQYSINNDLLNIFECSKDATRSINGYRGNICSCCRGELKTAYGYVWKYID